MFSYSWQKDQSILLWARGSWSFVAGMNYCSVSIQTSEHLYPIFTGTTRYLAQPQKGMFSYKGLKYALICCCVIFWYSQLLKKKPKKLYQWSPPTVYLPCCSPEWNELSKTLLKASFVFPPEEQCLWKAVGAGLWGGWDILCPSLCCCFSAEGDCKFIQPSQAQYHWESDIQQPEGGGSMERKSGSSFSPVLHPWLLKICFWWKQGVFSQQITIYSHQPTCVKLQGRKAPFLWLSAQPWPCIQNLLGLKNLLQMKLCFS